MAGDPLMPEATAPTGTGPRGDAAIKPGEDYRQLQQPEKMVEPWRVPSSGRSEEASALSSAFADFNKTVSGVRGALNAQAGAEAGTAAGNQPGFEQKTGLAALTASGEAFNKAGHVAYVAASGSANEIAIQAAEGAYPKDPQGFATQVQAIRDATLKQTPDMYKDEVARAIDLRSSAGQIRISERATVAAQETDKAAYTDTQPERFRVAAATASALPEGPRQDFAIQSALKVDNDMIQNMVSTGTITKEQAVVARDQAESKLVEEVHKGYATNMVGNIMTHATAGDVPASDRAMQQYLADPANNIDDKNRVHLEYERQREELVADQSHLHAKDIASIDTRLAQTAIGPGESGKSIQNDIEHMHTIGAMSDQQYESNLKTVHANQQDQIRTDGDLQQTDDRLHGQGPPLDQKSPEDMKSLDTWWQHQAAQHNQPVGSDGRTNALVNLMRLTGGAIPESERTQMRIALTSGDVQAATIAAKTAETLQNANPTANVFNDPRLESIARTISSGTDAGLDATTAHNMALQNALHPKDEVQLNKDYAKIQKQYPESNANALTAALKTSDTFTAGVPRGFFGGHGIPDVPPQMTTAYNGLVKRYYDSGSDIDQSRALAARAIQRTWGISQINTGKPEIVENPIEHQTAATLPEIRSDIETSALNQGGYRGDPKALHIAPDPTAKGLWNISFIDPKTGIEEPLRRDDGQILRYAPPTPDRAQIAARRDDLEQSRRGDFELKRATEEEKKARATQMETDIPATATGF